PTAAASSCCSPTRCANCPNNAAAFSAGRRAGAPRKELIMTAKPILWIVIPCYNEQEVLPITAPQFLQKVQDLAAAGLVSGKSRICFVNDGSRDATWQLICQFSRQDEHYIGISQSRNRGHQAAVLAGLMEARTTART